MRLYLVRHGIAEEACADDGSKDAGRQLTGTGIEKTRRSAAGLRCLGCRPGRILTSPLIRARQTADILADVLSGPPPEILDTLAPGGTYAATLSRLARFPDTTILCVGHEPDLSRLLSACLCRGTALHPVFKKAGAAILCFESQACGGRAWLEAFLPPRVLRRIAGRARQ